MLPRLERDRFTAREVSQQSPATVVLQETNHRIGNMLTILAAELRHDLMGFADLEVRNLLSRHERRIIELGELNKLLALGELDSYDSGQTYLVRLLESLSRTVLSPIQVHCEAIIGSGTISAEQCRWLSRLVTELILNAAKHAFGNSNDGLVRVALSCRGSTWLCTVLDNGTGISGSRVGSGSLIIASLVRLLEGSMTTCSGAWGTAVAIVFPTVAATTTIDCWVS